MTSTNTYSAYARGAVIGLQRYMEKNPLLHKNVQDLWNAHPGDSRSMIEKAFKPITGYRIKEYLVLVRLQQTKQLLREGMPIKRVAAKSYYKSQSAYCTAFKRYFNLSPTDWLKDGQP
ncbi:hypothetical protein A4D02_13690 [Niastella koreensis]|uniref:Transcriptional regulator, AraC family n=2 Tax=Niastella koreensis TaxID=354356 RepID=G8TNS9_NIAKG|nr:helix-turn-helix domain-containing protein [Niastella koreensis]AEW01005.1 transcriptional regulator, AraC family [Niastella koreensis GR20-10]OQP42613.1 hypothetical protein A4D02_13690 [Niastella koreensis]